MLYYVNFNPGLILQLRSNSYYSQCTTTHYVAIQCLR